MEDRSKRSATEAHRKRCETRPIVLDAHTTPCGASETRPRRGKERGREKTETAGAEHPSAPNALSPLDAHQPLEVRMMVTAHHEPSANNPHRTRGDRWMNPA